MNKQTEYEKWCWAQHTQDLPITCEDAWNAGYKACEKEWVEKMRSIGIKEMEDEQTN